MGGAVAGEKRRAGEEGIAHLQAIISVRGMGTGSPIRQTREMVCFWIDELKVWVSGLVGWWGKVPRGRHQLLHAPAVPRPSLDLLKCRACTLGTLPYMYVRVDDTSFTIILKIRSI